LVTDEALAGTRGVEAVVRAAVAGGVTMVQVREKRGDARAFLDHTRALGTWLRTLGVPLIVNDRVDIALAAGADGVHVGQGDLPCIDVRRLVGPHRLVGVSVGSVDEARQAERDGADYLGVSPIFATPTKPDAPPPVGLQGLRAIRAAVRLPLVAIGGIHAGNAAQILAAGADGIAVVSAIMSAPDPTAAARELLASLSYAKTPQA
jgi:thiamine-phosphate pyrophosphorylase